MIADWLLNWLPSWVLQNQLLLLFTSAFFSATLLPGNSELLFSGLLLINHFNSPFDIFQLWLVATLGNTLGSLVNYTIGRIVAVPEWHTLNHRQQRGIRWLYRYGNLSLILSWLPLFGDLLCIAAGWLRLPWLGALLFIALGKGLRYLILIGLTLL